MAKLEKTEKILITISAIGAMWYLVFRFAPPVKSPTSLGGSNEVPTDIDFNHAQVIHAIMRQCWKKHTLSDFLQDRIFSDEDFERLYNAFATKPYDRCWYELNLPDFMYPELDLFQWMYEFASESDRKQVNTIFQNRSIQYRL